MAKESAYVVQQPHSNTNPTDKFRVTDSDGLSRYINGATTSYAFTEHRTYAEAAAKRDELNGTLPADVNVVVIMDIEDDPEIIGIVLFQNAADALAWAKSKPANPNINYIVTRPIAPYDGEAYPHG